MTEWEQRLLDMVDGAAYVGNMPTVITILNQIAHGTETECVRFVNSCGGSNEIGQEFHRACREIIKKPERGWCSD